MINLYQSNNHTASLASCVRIVNDHTTLLVDIIIVVSIDATFGIRPKIFVWNHIKQHATTYMHMTPHMFSVKQRSVGSVHSETWFGVPAAV